MVQLFKRGSGPLRSGFVQRAVMDRFGRGPQAAAAGVAKERTGFPFHALAFAAGGQEQQEQNELGKRALAVATKVLRRSLEIACEPVGN